MIDPFTADGRHDRVPAPLADLATFHGIQTGYEDWRGNPQTATAPALVAALQALGVPIDGPSDAGAVLERSRADRWRLPVDPVVAAIGDRSVTVHLRLPRDQAGGTSRCHLVHESGEEHRWDVNLADVQPDHVQDVDGRAYVALPLRVENLPHGHHRFVVEHDAGRDETLLLIAPARAYAGPEGTREWGAFLPLYALRTSRDWGAGDVTDLRELATWAREQGANVVGTLPLLPAYLGDEHGRVPFDPSPYSPVSRLFWNELYLDLGRAPELQRCPEARRMLGSDEVANSVAELRSRGDVDYRRLAALKSRVLRRLSSCFFEQPGARRDAFERFVARRPLVEDYALFRGAVARWGTRWSEWPVDLLRNGRQVEDVDAGEARFHAYAQFLAEEQIGDLSTRLRDDGMRPYLDLPVGTRRDGFDTWRFGDQFATGASVGAPPDKVFTGGQNWEFPPLHPQRLRGRAYEHLRDVFAHHMALADVLRIDHVMGLHRLFWIPDGVDAGDGVYVRYPAHELYAVVLLESHRHRSQVVGEDLGTVPTEVEDACRARGIVRMYVVQYEVHPDRESALEPVPADSTASVNTHDMPPFAAFWDGLDIDDGVDLGLLAPAEADEARSQRAKLLARLAGQLVDEGLLSAEATDDPAAVHAAVLEWLGRSDAPLVLANVEDLWLEQRPQNTPGTQEERSNWRRRAARDLADIRSSADVSETLQRLHNARTGGTR